MAKIIINRKSQFMNRLRRFDVYIDGQKAGAVKNAGAEEFNVAAGKHTVYCKLSRYSSNVYELNIGENEVKFLSVASNMKYFSVVYVLLIIALIAPLATRNSSWYYNDVFQWSRAGLLLILVGYMLYFAFFARDKYMKIEEDKNNIFNS